MKPYLKHTSPRPGCSCCNTKNLHGFTARKTDAHRAAIRAGKKAVRSSIKKEIRKELNT